VGLEEEEILKVRRTSEKFLQTTQHQWRSNMIRRKNFPDSSEGKYKQNKIIMNAQSAKKHERTYTDHQ